MSNVMSGNPSRHRGGPWQPLRLIPSGRVAGEYTGGSLDHMAGETHSAAEEPRRPAPRHSVRTFSQRAWARVAEVAARRMAPLAASPVPEPEPVLPPPPEEVLDLLRHLGITMSRAGEPADRVALILGQRRHRVRRHRPHVLRGADRSVRAHRPGTVKQCGLRDGRQHTAAPRPGGRAVPPDRRHPAYPGGRRSARARLQDLLTVEPRFGAIAAILGSGVLTVGLGLMLNPTASALPAFLFPGLARRDAAVGGPRADPQPRPAGCRRHCRDLAGVQVAGACTRHISTGHRHPLAGHLPAGRSADHGDSRAVNGRHARGIGAPGRRLGTPTPPDLRHHHGRAYFAGLAPSTSQAYQPGARPRLGVLIFGAGQYVALSAAAHLGWLLVVLYTAYGVQALSGRLLGPQAPVSSQPRWSCRCATRSRAAEVGRPCRSPSSPRSGCWCSGRSTRRRRADRGCGPVAGLPDFLNAPCRSSRSPWASSSARGFRSGSDSPPRRGEGSSRVVHPGHLPGEITGLGRTCAARLLTDVGDIYQH